MDIGAIRGNVGKVILALTTALPTAGCCNNNLAKPIDPRTINQASLTVEGKPVFDNRPLTDEQRKANRLLLENHRLENPVNQNNQVKTTSLKNTRRKALTHELATNSR